MQTKEVARWIPAISSYEESTYCDGIFDIEYDLFDGCIGLDYRELMIIDRIEYSNVAAYDEEKVYANNALMYFDGKVYKSKSSNNSSPITDTTKWMNAPYFNDFNFNFLWQHGMAKWIASAVYEDTIIPATYKTGNKGTMKFQGDDLNQVTVNYRELGAVKGDTVDKKTRAYNVLKKVIERYHGKTQTGTSNVYDFSGIEFMKDVVDCGANSCNESEEGNSRIAFLN